MEPDGTTFASVRDEDYYKTKGLSLGGLRNHYYFVKTPLRGPTYLEIPEHLP